MRALMAFCCHPCEVRVSQCLLEYGVHADEEGKSRMQDAEMHMLYYEVLHADSELVSIRSIDSMTQPSEHVCFDLAKHYSSYKVPYRVCIMYPGRGDPLCLHAPRSG